MCSAPCSPYMYHAIRSGWTNQITRLFIPREMKIAKMQIMVQYTYILLYSKAIVHKCGQCCSPPSSLSLERKMMDQCLPAVVIFPQRRYLEFILSCVFLSLFLFGSQSLVLLLLSNFPSIASLAPLFPSFLAVVVIQCVCAVGFLLARLDRGGHPRRAFDCNLKYP